MSFTRHMKCAVVHSPPPNICSGNDQKYRRVAKWNGQHRGVVVSFKCIQLRQIYLLRSRHTHKEKYDYM